ncbi:MAG: phosphoenolpyruvate--protein phosphotransferase [Planctomycetota bacterium]
MQALQGIAVSAGIAIGEALVNENEGIAISRRTIAPDAIDAELARLDAAIKAVSIEIDRDRQMVADQLGQTCGTIFAAHRQMIEDEQLHEELEREIRNQVSPELAVHHALRRYARVFQQMENAYLAERAQDLFDLEERLLAHLLERRQVNQAELKAPTIILAHELTPSETARLDRKWVVGFVTEAGGQGSHTAILAKGLELPAVVGTGPLLADVANGDLVIVDGDRGAVLIAPEEQTVAKYHEQIARRSSQIAELASLRDLPCETIDGHGFQLLANIEFPHEISACQRRNAAGIGLYRTEFLYLSAEREPTEEDHYTSYCEVVRAMGDRPVVIRTLDLGADKMGLGQPVSDEHNPFLGLRSIRLSLRNVDLFRTQLRAILRASALGNVKILLPLIATLSELRQAKLFLRETMEDLEDAGIAFDRDIPVGMMVEVPSAVVMIENFLREVDFISVGTNDLIQYALAVDRSNKDVADLYQGSDPAVVQLIAKSVAAAQAAGIPASVCGQMSGTPHFAILFLGLGLTEFSLPSSTILEIKRVLRSVTLERCQQIANIALQMETADEIDAFLKEELKKIVPELIS